MSREKNDIPLSGERLRSTKMVLNRVRSDPTRRSHVSAMFMPAPTAIPFTAAIVGFARRACESLRRAMVVGP